jgi:alkylation response protein AidB-like acyl-CoA dehydrogenase
MQHRYLFEGPEHAQLREQARRFAKKKVAPFADRWEEQRVTDKDRGIGSQRRAGAWAGSCR